MSSRVLFLDHAGVLSGAELYLLDLARRYRDSSRVVLLQDGPFYDRLQDEAIDARVVAAPPALTDVSKKGNLVSAAQAVPAIISTVRAVSRMAADYDVIYANSQKALIVGGLAGLFAGVPVIWNLHDLLTKRHFSLLNRTVAVQCANHLTDRVIVNSHATQQSFIESGGRSEKSYVVYNGFEEDEFADVSDDRVDAVRRSLGLDGAPVVGVFSRLAPWKGQHVLLQALANLPSAPHVMLVGDALFGSDSPYVTRLEEMARRLGVEDRVHFLGFREDVPLLMKASDIVAHTSVAPEPFGRVVVEGMLARRPVVAADAGGVPEIIDHEKTGFLYPPGDADALAARLRRLLTDTDAAETVAEAGYQRARQRFSLEEMTRSVADHIDAAVRSETS